MQTTLKYVNCITYETYEIASSLPTTSIKNIIKTSTMETSSGESTPKRHARNGSSGRGQCLRSLACQVGYVWVPFEFRSRSSIGLTGYGPLVFPGPTEALGNHSSGLYLSGSSLKMIQVKRLVIVR
jgi:hypothetical protein